MDCYNGTKTYQDYPYSPLIPTLLIFESNAILRLPQGYPTEVTSVEGTGIIASASLNDLELVSGESCFIQYDADNNPETGPDGREAAIQWIIASALPTDSPTCSPTNAPSQIPTNFPTVSPSIGCPLDGKGKGATKSSKSPAIAFPTLCNSAKSSKALGKGHSSSSSSMMMMMKHKGKGKKD